LLLLLLLQLLQLLRLQLQLQLLLRLLLLLLHLHSGTESATVHYHLASSCCTLVPVITFAGLLIREHLDNHLLAPLLSLQA
jgi:hypothetical protein